MIFKNWNSFVEALKNMTSGNEISNETIKHSKSYSKLLDLYTSATKANIIIKSILKIVFFIITIGCLVAVVYIFYMSLTYSFSIIDKFKDNDNISLEAVLSLITILVPSISSLIVGFLKLPEIIAKYLFNIEEDTFMNDIIKNIQAYDKDMFAMEHKVEELLLKNKNASEESKDEEIKESPKESNKKGTA